MPLLGEFSYHSFIIVMCPYPSPYEIVTILDCKSPVIHASSNGPKISDFLEMERRMSGIIFQKVKVLFRNLLNRLWKLLETFPEPSCRPVHLKVLQLSLIFFINSFFDQKI